MVDHYHLGPEHLRLEGYTYLWMFLIWGTAFYAAEVECKYMKARRWIYLYRCIVYVATAWMFEYTTGWILRRFTGTCPWDYSHANSNIDGLIRLDYAPCWVFTGTLSEVIYPLLDAICYDEPIPRVSRSNGKQSRHHMPARDEDDDY